MTADDFRFLEGHFRVRHERLDRRLVGSTNWVAFETELWGYPVMGGSAFVDEMYGVIDDREFWGMTLRLFDASSGEWTLFWADTWHRGLGPPLTGRFENGLGEFIGVDEHEGREVLVRYRWMRIEEAVPKWEQAFSTDGGASWEVNWIMEFERLGDGRPV